MDEEYELAPDPMLGAGTWSNQVRVMLGREELVIDFIVADPVEPRAAIVARIAISPGGVRAAGGASPRTRQLR